MSKLLILVALVCGSATAHATCEEPTKVSQLSEAYALAEQAFADLDDTSLLAQASLARTQILPCVDEVLTKVDAAAYHRLMAMEAFFNNNGVRTVQELHAALLLEPGYEFPEEVVDPNHPLRMLYTTAETAPDGDGEKIYPPPRGYVLVGGVRNSARYSKTPVIIQVFDSAGVLRETRYIQPGEAVPNWSGNAFGLTAEDIGIDLDDLRRSSVLSKPAPWYVLAGSGAIASGVLYGVALHQKNVYLDPSTPDDRLAELEASANTLATTSAITSGATALFTGLGIGFHVKFGARNKSTSTHDQDVGGGSQ